MNLVMSLMVLLIPSVPILFQIDRAGAELIHVVSPSAYADTESSGAVNSPAPSGRYQQIFLASDFESLPADVRTITGFAYRPDGGLTTPLQGRYTSLIVSFSTTSITPGQLSMVFDENVGADEVIVFEGANVDSSTQNDGPLGGPKVFDMSVALQTPFEYDPSKGNLLMDVLFGFEGGFSTDFVTVADPNGQLIGANPARPTATFSLGGFVTQFTAVPEPSTVTLFTMAGMVGAFMEWRKRRRT